MEKENQPIDQNEGNRDSESIQAFYNWGDTAPSVAVVDTVAFAAHRELTDLPLLYEVVNPEALDTLVASSSASQTETRLSISFIYADCAVTVQCTGEVCVQPSA